MGYQYMRNVLNTVVYLVEIVYIVQQSCTFFLQDVLQPAAFSKFSSNKEICLSMASSVFDVCKKDPDRGVDLILSISVGNIMGCSI